MQPRQPAGGNNNLRAALPQRPVLDPFTQPTRPWPVTSYLTEEEKQLIVATMPELRLIATPGMRRSEHPISHLERGFSEQIAIENLQALGAVTVLDVGGNPRRHTRRQAANLLVWSTCPELSPEDSARNTDYRLGGVVNWCDHLAQDCNCIMPDALLSVHSIYYLQPATVWQLLRRTRLKVGMVVCHMFDAALDFWWPSSGKIARDNIVMKRTGPDVETTYGRTENQFEAHYWVTGDRVTMNVRGQSHTYVHSACTWMHHGTYDSGDSTVPIEERAVHWMELRTVGHTKLYRFTLGAPTAKLPIVELPFREALRSKHYYGEVNMRGVTMSETTLTPVFERMASRGSWFTTNAAIVPKDLVHQVSARVTGRVRDKDTLALAVDVAGKLLLSYNMPQVLVPQSKALAGYLGFLANMEFESNLLEEHIAPHGSDVAAFNTRLKEPFIDDHWKVMLAGTLVLGGLIAWRQPRRADFVSAILELVQPPRERMSVATPAANPAMGADIALVAHGFSAVQWNCTQGPIWRRPMGLLQDIDWLHSAAHQLLKPVYNSVFDWLGIKRGREFLRWQLPAGDRDTERTLRRAQSEPDRSSALFSSLISFGVLAPLQEEAIKRTPGLRWIMALEALAYLRKDGVATAAQSAIFHLITAQLSYPNAVFVHAVWNIYCCLYGDPDRGSCLRTDMDAIGVLENGVIKPRWFSVLSTLGSWARPVAMLLGLLAAVWLVKRYRGWLQDKIAAHWTPRVMSIAALLRRLRPSPSDDIAREYRLSRRGVASSAYNAPRALDKPLCLPDTDNPPPRMSLLEDEAKLRMRFPLDLGRERENKLQAVGLVVPALPPVVSANTFNNQARALIHRQGIQRPTVDPAHAKQFMRFVKDEFRLYHEEILRRYHYPGREAWVCRFPAARQAQLRAAMLAVDTVGLMPQDLVIDAFVKKEKVTKAPRDGPGDWHAEEFGYGAMHDVVYDPRNISAQRPKAMVVCGPFLFGVQNAMKRVYNYTKPWFYTSGSNAALSGDWLHRNLEHVRVTGLLPDLPGPPLTYLSILEVDQKRLDGHVQEANSAPTYALYDELVYRAQHPEAFAARDAIAEIDAKNTSKMPLDISMTTRGRVQSGRQDTNCLDTSICFQANQWAATSMTGLLPSKDAERIPMMGTGDDGGIILPFVPDTAAVNRFEQAMLQIGLEVEMYVRPLAFDGEYYHGIEQYRYCSALFWPVERQFALAYEEDEEAKRHGCVPAVTFVMGPMPGRLLARLGWDITGTTKPAQFMRGVALGLRDDCWHVPFAHELIERILALTKDIEAAPIQEPDSFHRIHVDRRYTRHPHYAWVFTQARYGLNKDDLDQFVRDLREIKSLPAIGQTFIIRKLVTVDTEVDIM